MDGLSGVASGMAVVSLSLQLIESISKIKNFVRDVKGASKELQRLIESLDRLSALLQDVRDIMERQTSLQDQQFPAPSMTIFSCIKSCEASLQPLQDVIEKYSKVPDGSSRLLRVKEDIRFGFKTKDIAGIEIRIQREITCLQEALGLNNTSIMITVFPLLLQSQQSQSMVGSQTQQLTIQTSSLAPAPQYTRFSAVTARPRVTRKRSRVPSILENFGITQHKSISYIRRDHQHSYGTSEESQDAVYESREFLIWWRIFGYGRCWKFQYPYGSILPSLSVHPVVEYFDSDVYALIKIGSIQDIQRYFTTGELHPFTRDIYGTSLLHLAAYYCKPEVCCLLIDYGVGHCGDREYRSPIMCCFFDGRFSSAHRIDVIRTLLPHDDFALDNPNIFCDYLGLTVLWRKQIIEWVLENATTFYCGEQAILLRKNIFITTIARLGWRHRDLEEMLGFLCESMDEHLLTQYKRGSLRLLPKLFSYTEYASDSISAGDDYIALLTFWGCDVEACIQMELEALEDGCLMVDKRYPIPRKVVFTGDQYQGWSLDWEWVYDCEDIGYELVSEYSSLAADTILGWHWPFSEQHELSPEGSMRRMDNMPGRFNRRMAAKARKESVRLGQKRTRSRMPGAWI